MTTAREIIGATAGRLASAGVASARAEARLLLAHALGGAPYRFLGFLEVEVPPEFDTFVERRMAGEPISYITGKREFWSFQFEVGPGALIPRPETETLVEQVLLEFPRRDGALAVLDLGTGSGCIAIALLREYPNAHAVAVDESDDALVFAERNAFRHDVRNRFQSKRGDWTDGIDAMYDIVIANPPYIASGDIATLARDVSGFEPRQALDGGSDGLAAYQALAPRINARLKPHGRAILELGAGQAEAVSGIFAAAGLETIRVGHDLSGVKRCLVARRTFQGTNPVQKTVGNSGPSR